MEEAFFFKTCFTLNTANSSNASDASIAATAKLSILASIINQVKVPIEIYLYSCFLQTQ